MSDQPHDKRVRVLWLHTQPEHYHNGMLDDLARGTPYLGVGPEGGGGIYEYIAAFSAKGPGWYKDNAQPQVARTVFLTPVDGMEKVEPAFWGKYHADWRADLLPLNFDVAVVSGYGSRTHRELIAHCHRHGIPVAMWSDSNMRSQQVTGLKAGVKRGLKKFFLQRIHKKTDLLLTANSQGIAYWQFFGAAAEKIRISACYSDYRRVDAAQSQPRSEVLRRIGLRAEDRILLTSARLVEHKGIDLMIEAFARARLHTRGYTYVVTGTGPFERELKKQVRAHGGVEKAICFAGFQQPADNLALMAHADLFILPSRYEPHGIVVGEALAAGTPVVASDVVGAAADLIQPGVSGETFKNNDAADLEQVLERVLDPAQGILAAMRKNTRPTFEAWYAKTSPMKVVPEAVGRLLARRSGGSTQVQ